MLRCGTVPDTCVSFNLDSVWPVPLVGRSGGTLLGRCRAVTLQDSARYEGMGLQAGGVAARETRCACVRRWHILFVFSFFGLK